MLYITLTQLRRPLYRSNHVVLTLNPLYHIGHSESFHQPAISYIRSPVPMVSYVQAQLSREFTGSSGLRRTKPCREYRQLCKWRGLSGRSVANSPFLIQPLGLLRRWMIYAGLRATLAKVSTRGKFVVPRASSGGEREKGRDGVHDSTLHPGRLAFICRILFLDQAGSVESVPNSRRRIRVGWKGRLLNLCVTWRIFLSSEARIFIFFFRY